MRLFLVLAAAAPLFAQTPCPYALAPSQPVSIAAVSSTGQITVYAGNDCTWTYRTGSPSWIAFTPPSVTSGSGNLFWSAAS